MSDSRRRRSQEDSLISRKYLLNSLVYLAVVPALAMIASFISPHNASSAALSHRIMKATRQSKVYSHPEVIPNPPYALFSTRVVLPSHRVQPAYVLVAENGTITGVTRSLAATPSFARGTIVDVSPLVIMAGLIDTHVHVNEPGREDWEGFYHATRAAAAGGTTTILDMPLNNVPSTTTSEALTAKLKALAAATSYIDVGLIGGVVPKNIHEVQTLVDGGVIALKSFLVDSQSEDFPHITKPDLDDVIEELDRLLSKGAMGIKAIPYILHAELDDLSPDTGSRAAASDAYDHSSYEHFERARPDSWETNAIKMAAKVANNTNLHLHIAHVSSSEALREISKLRQSPTFHAKLTAETCPQYLLWAKEEIPAGATRHKCTPPIRSKNNREMLRKSLFTKSEHSHAIDLIASDHSPCPDELKETNGNLTSAWGGIAGLQYRLQGSWASLGDAKDGLVTIAKLLAEGPAQTFHLDHIKGFLQKGYDADMVIWDPSREVSISEEGCYHRHKGSPFHGDKLRGNIAYSLLRGETVYSKSTDQKPGNFGDAKGRLLYRSSEDGIIRSADRRDWQMAHEPGE